MNFESGELMAGMGVPEIAYIVEKLYNMIVYHSSQAALKEAARKEMEARLIEVGGTNPTSIKKMRRNFVKLICRP